MRYSELIEFEPLESVIQLREADDKEEARHLVESYVVSDRMAEYLCDLVIPQLRLDRAADNKGVFVVGNYGTGKSHLMSVLSSVAEHADLANGVRNERVRGALQAIAGQFKVVRTEIGGVTRSLRGSILEELEIFLEEMGTPYEFPPADQITNNKDSLIEAMAAFQQHYPNHGVLFVLDELLDHLRSRNERELILDLGFLRELGEVVELTPFRFLAGVQESLFDSPRFTFMADQLRRVRDRFEQVRIAREDIAFVVSERLLRKSDEQLAKITEHLRRFAPLYPPLGEQLGLYARLFPIHPAYIDTFEQVYIAEQREVLKTFSSAIRRVLPQEVPEEQPGLISYDHYWSMIKDNPSLRTLPGVSDVVEKSDVLAGRIRNAYTRKSLLPLAERIVDALSVHRLTTSDVNTPLGVTVEELRDGLCLWTPMPEADAQFLADTVQVALREIMRTVSGQYISYNEENGQYYLDLKKVVDFDANITRRGEFMEPADLNKYFYDALRQMFTDLPSSVHVTGYRIWQYELPWDEKKVTRPGYLFFGMPDERSTAQPPRDFYIYIQPPFATGTSLVGSDTETQSDEVLFTLTGLDSEFESIIRNYAGAREMALQSPAHAHTYNDKADNYGRQLRRWLEQNLNSQLQVHYRGVSRSVPEVLAGTRSSASQDTEELLKLIAAHLLEPLFAERYPDYPAFTGMREPITETARPTNAADAIGYLGGRGRTNLAINVLAGLHLIDENERVRTQQSPYAVHFLDLLHQKGETQVVNHGEVLQEVSGGLQPIRKDGRFWLEPEWVAVVLLALVYDGQIELNLGGNEILNAGNVDRAALRAIEDLTEFRFYKRPRGLSLPVWQQIFDGLGLQAGLIREESTRHQAVQQLQERVQSELTQVVTWQNEVGRSLTLWNESLFTDRIDYQVQGGNVVSHSGLAATHLSQTDLLPALRGTKAFLERLSRYNTPGKLRNLSLNAAEVNEGLAQRQQAQRVRQVLQVVTQLSGMTGYLSEARANLPDEDEWVSAARVAKEELLNSVRRMAKGEEEISLPRWQQRLEQLKREYIAHYAALHSQHVLGPRGDDRRTRLVQSPAARQAGTLAQIDIFNAGELESWQRIVRGVPACRQFHEGLLDDTPTCPHCHFRPSQINGQPAEERLSQLEERLDSLLAQWHAGLRQALQSNTAQQSRAAMTPREQAPLDAYLALEEPAGRELPNGLVGSANRALRGLTTVSVQVTELVRQLQAGGLPCTVDELHTRFHGYLQKLLRGHDAENTRFTIEE